MTSNHMVSVVSSIHTGGNFIFAETFLKPIDVNFLRKCQKCQIYVICENLLQIQRRHPLKLPCDDTIIWHYSDVEQEN